VERDVREHLQRPDLRSPAVLVQVIEVAQRGSLVMHVKAPSGAAPLDVFTGCSTVSSTGKDRTRRWRFADGV
jgi:hypothetical protein